MDKSAPTQTDKAGFASSEKVSKSGFKKAITAHKDELGLTGAHGTSHARIEQLETALKDSGLGIKEANFEDRLDDLRAKLPSYSHTQLKKLLEDAGGDVEKAVRSAPRTGGGALEML